MIDYNSWEDRQLDKRVAELLGYTVKHDKHCEECWRLRDPTLQDVSGGNGRNSEEEAWLLDTPSYTSDWEYDDPAFIPVDLAKLLKHYPWHARHNPFSSNEKYWVFLYRLKNPEQVPTEYVGVAATLARALVYAWLRLNEDVAREAPDK